MRVLWMLVKIAIGLAIAVPLGLFVMALTFGLVAAAVRLAFIGLVAYGVYRVARFFFAPAAPPPRPAALEPASVDPYYAAAMRELDSELRR